VRLFLGALVVFTAAAQPLSFGLKAGATLTGDLDGSSATSESKRVTFGPAVVVRLPRGFSVEVDALYQRVGYRSDSSFFGLSYSYTRARGNSWQFPLLLRKTLAHGLYFGAGVVPRTIDGNEQATLVQATTLEHTAYQITQSQYPGEWRSEVGVAGVAGYEKRLGKLHIGPEVRYTRWTHPSLDVQGSRGFSILSNQNQVDVLLTVRFP
jgi:alpha-mannosidase